MPGHGGRRATPGRGLGAGGRPGPLCTVLGCPGLLWDTLGRSGPSWAMLFSQQKTMAKSQDKAKKCGSGKGWGVGTRGCGSLPGGWQRAANPPVEVSEPASSRGSCHCLPCLDYQEKPSKAPNAYRALFICLHFQKTCG